MRIGYVILICFGIGFLAPIFINQRLEFTEKSDEVPGMIDIEIPIGQNVNLKPLDGFGYKYTEKGMDW